MQFGQAWQRLPERRCRKETMKTLLIVYHSLTGGTLQMAEAAARGAGGEAGVRTRLLHARDAGPDDVLEADGYLFATPENLAAMSGLLKVSSTAATTRRLTG